MAISVSKTVLGLFGIYVVVSIAFHIHHVHHMRWIKKQLERQAAEAAAARAWRRQHRVTDAGSMPTDHEFKPTWATRQADADDRQELEYHELAVHTGPPGALI